MEYDESAQDDFLDGPGGAQDQEPEDNDSEWRDDPEVDAIRIALRDLASTQYVMSLILLEPHLTVLQVGWVCAQGQANLAAARQGHG